MNGLITIGQLLSKTETKHLPTTYTTKSPESEAVVNRYGTEANFLALFNPDNQARYCTDLSRVYLGSAPTLGLVAKSYGSNIAEAWLEIQLKDLSDFAGCKDKLDGYGTEKVARVIISQFGYLKVTELMHFFLLFKSGAYGHFYGVIDPIRITEALREFIVDRADRKARYTQERDRLIRAEEEAKHDASVDEFNSALAVSNMSIPEWYELNKKYHLSVEEVRHLGWLLR